MAKERKLNGWHVFGIFGGAFAVIIGVNIVLAVSAVKTFPGLEVDNSYVASQTFNNRLQAQQALGWTVNATSEGDRLILAITDKAGKPVQVGNLQATLGRPTQVRDDRTPDFIFDGTAYVAKEPLDDGNWNIRMTATSLEGIRFEQRVVLHVDG